MTSLSYPEKVIKYMMLKNHIYIKSKWDCLKHLFVIKNNCCYWNNEGDFILFEPVTDKMVDEVKISTSFIRDPNVLRMMKSHTKEYIDKIEINSKFELMMAVFTSENIDMLCKKTPEGFPNPPKVSDLDNFNKDSLFWKAPKNVNKEWKDVLIETGDIIQRLLWEKDLNEKSTNNRNEWNNELNYNVYMEIEKKLFELDRNRNNKALKNLV